MVEENKVTLRSIFINPCLGLCNPTYCTKRCIDFMTIEKQKEINRKLLESNIKQIRSFIIQNVIKLGLNQWEYHLEGFRVCRKMFCNTIGNKNALNIMRFIDNNGIDRRSNNNKKNHWKSHSLEFNEEIEKFLEAFDPQYSHYRRKQCMNRRCISAKHELNPFLCYLKFCEKMIFLPKYKNQILNTLINNEMNESIDSHNEFNENNYRNKRKSNGIKNCNYDYFDKKRRQLNIHFEVNSNDLCNVCVEHSIHHNLKYSEKNCDYFCELCKSFEIHIKSANDSRNLMRTFAKDSDNSRVILTADMQKALLFPIIAVKNNFFSEKLTLPNQTFAGLGPNTESFCYISFDAEIAKGSNEFVKKSDHSQWILIVSRIRIIL
jgi:hypothetical protein